MNKIFIYLFILSLISCASKPKIENRPENVVVTKIDQTRPENWADEYYNNTVLILESPTIIESYREMQAICKGDDFIFNTQYQKIEPEPVLYKKIPLTIQTKGGFSKKVYVNKGHCREITLYKAPSSQQARQIRFVIKEMELLYIYNQGSYLKTLTFDTTFKDVKFVVQ